MLLSDPDIVAKLVRFASHFIDVADEGREAFTSAALTSLAAGPGAITKLSESTGPYNDTAKDLVLDLAGKVVKVAVFLLPRLLALYASIVWEVIERVAEVVVGLAVSAVKAIGGAIAKASTAWPK